MKSEITIIATIKADINKVWNYWTSPKHIKKWNFASTDWYCPSAVNDLRVGGNMIYRMAAKDGSFAFDFEGVYDEVIYQSKIVYSMSDGRIATTVFDVTQETTIVKTVFDAELENPIEMQKAGWQAILDNFKLYAEAN